MKLMKTLTALGAFMFLGSCTTSGLIIDYGAVPKNSTVMVLAIQDLKECVRTGVG